MKRYGKARTQQLKVEAKLTDRDRAELEKFRGYLRDSESKSLLELIQIHGADYLGFTAEELLKTLKL